ncbi:MAG: YCII-related protein, partial [Actinoallomurus sp.]|nr:YCII-related protein [Actinoallomurus sp.]
ITGWARLHAEESATTLRNDEGRMLLTDGPFIDSEEYLAGLFLIEADNLDAALAVAEEAAAEAFAIAAERRHETPEPEPATEPTTEPATEPTTEPATEPATESATEPTTDSITEPATESATEPTVEPTTEPTTAPAACPRCGAAGEAPCTTPSGKATKTHKGREQ